MPRAQTVPEGTVEGREILRTLTPDTLPPSPTTGSLRLSTGQLPGIPSFTLLQNTTHTELRALEDQYPARIHNRNYQQLTHMALQEDRQHIKRGIEHIRRLQAAREAFVNARPKFRDVLLGMLGNNISNSEVRYVEGLHDEGMQQHHSMLEHRLIRYCEIRDIFIKERAELGSLQAQYNQRAAMIRQKPSIPVEVNLPQILNTVSQWDNVWGIAIGKIDDILMIRVGLSDIVIQESALDTQYENPMDITLAPFYITIELAENGRFYCRSESEKVLGLSRYHGGTSWDVHPHQLSDSPCFGTFGQTLLDLANSGDMITHIATLIAFYSQYNSDDSAGVAANCYHPANLQAEYHIPSYCDLLASNVRGVSEYHNVDKDKLLDAMRRYHVYYEIEKHERAPERIDAQRCAACEATDVSDNTEYYVSANDERICTDCWNDHYCSDCERYCDDCNCDRED